MRKLVSILLIAAMLFTCSSVLADQYPAKVPGIDFGGAPVTIYDYWSGNGGRNPEPTDEEIKQYAYQDWINSTYNVDLSQKQGGDWGSNASEMSNFTTKPDGSLRMYIIEPGSVASLISNGVATSISNKYVDFQAKKWNSAERNFMTIGGKLYGMYAGNSEPRGVLYFNKRVLAEAGIDWNSIYDMQKAGTWTWAEFEKMLNAITRDTDGDGMNDIYGILGSSDDMYVCATFANGGSFFDFDADGKLQPTMNSDATMNALTWGKNIKDRYWAPTPEAANWDWYKDAWKQGYCGFYMYQCYGGFNDNSEMADMADEWGAVAFPVPKAGDPYVTVVSDNITLIPSCYDEETVAKLAFLYDLWTNNAPGTDQTDDWIGNKYSYTDDRAVDETYAMLRQPDHNRVNKVLYLGTQNDVLGTSLLWGLDGNSLGELIEAGMPAWQALCDTFNEAFPGAGQEDSGQDEQHAGGTLVDFVNRNYSLILDREADPEGQKNWTEALKAGTISGGELMQGFLNSPEFKQKPLTNEEKVEILYNVMLGRGSDPEGKAYWLERLNIGMSINAIAAGFVGSNEFIGICNDFGINNGSCALTEARDVNAGVTGFINRCYKEALGRTPDVDGLNYWCENLNGQKMSAQEVAHGFVASQEMVNKGQTNEEYVTTMYELFLGREPDPDGLKYWIDRLDAGEDRSVIENGFAQSVEFKGIVESYGIK